MAEIRPFTDTDFSILIEGRTKDDGRAPLLGVSGGDKKPSFVAQFLSKDGSRFAQPLKSYFTLLAIAAHIETVAMYPGTEAIGKTIRIMRGQKGGDVFTGTTLTVSRRDDGLVSLRFENRDIRDAIFPINMNAGIEVETRLRSNEPYDMRMDYASSAVEFANQLRARCHLWMNDRARDGKEQMRDRMNGSSSWG